MKTNCFFLTCYFLIFCINFNSYGQVSTYQAELYENYKKIKIQEDKFVALQKITDPEILKRIVIESRHGLVAIQKIEDQTFLESIALNTIKLSKTATRSAWPVLLRAEAIKKLENQKIIVDIALRTPDWCGREDVEILAAISKVKNQDVIKKLALESSCWWIKKAAILRLENDSLLKSIAQTGDKEALYKIKDSIFIKNCFSSPEIMDKRDFMQPRIRLAAISNIQDNSFLKDIIATNENNEIVLQAILNVSDTIILNELVKNYKKGDYIYEIAILKLALLNKHIINKYGIIKPKIFNTTDKHSNDGSSYGNVIFKSESFKIDFYNKDYILLESHDFYPRSLPDSISIEHTKEGSLLKYGNFSDRIQYLGSTFKSVNGIPKNFENYRLFVNFNFKYFYNSLLFYLDDYALNDIKANSNNEQLKTEASKLLEKRVNYNMLKYFRID